MTEKIDCLVIGAGVVGLAVARALGMAGREVILIDRHESFGMETSSRNSEVIHAGMFYRPGGLRARLCAPGKAAMYDYCAARGVAHLRCEKLIVAQDADELARLRSLREQAIANGVADLELIDGREAARIEPGVRCVGALLSPSSGIVDSHGLMLALLGDLENAGGAFAPLSPALGGRVKEGGVEIDVGGAAPMTLLASLVVNCAGLWAASLAHAIDGLDARFIPTVRPAKGQYFTYSGKAPFSRLIYPLHTADSQGVHYTRDLGGQARLGPDISWEAPLGDYSVEESRRAMFVETARRFWPDLEPDRLQPGYAGQRPKTSGPGEEGDYRILGPAEHGTAGYIGLYGIESPGLTSCLAIGGYVAAVAAR